MSNETFKVRERLAVIFSGISYLNNSNQEVSVNNTTKVDYKYCLQSYERYLLPSLKAIFKYIDNFIITYNNEKIQEIINDYSPKDMMIIPECKMASRKKDQYKLRIFESCELIRQYIQTNNQKYDNILFIRFDYVYIQKIPLENLNLDIINFGWRRYVRDAGYIQTDDGFILCIPSQLDYIINCININPYPHQLHGFFSQYGYVLDINYVNNRYYVIYREYKNIYSENS